MRKFFHLRKRVPDIGGRRMLASMALVMASVGFTYANDYSDASPANPVDVTERLVNPAVSSENGWTNVRTASGEAYTGAPDNTYLDAWQMGNCDMYQRLTDLPIGKYRLVAAGRGHTAVKAFIYAESGGEKKSELINQLGNTGGELEKGWSWVTVDDIVVLNGELQVGFLSTTASTQWAGADDFKLYYLGDKGELKLVIDEAESLYGDGAGKSAAELKDAIDAAQAVVSDPDATMENYLDATKALRKVILQYNVDNASRANPADVTEWIVNPTMDATEGWFSTANASNKQLAYNKKGDFTGFFYEHWNSSAFTGKFYQVIENIPNGIYSMKAAVFGQDAAAVEGSLYLYANEYEVAVIGDEPIYYTVDNIVVVDGTLEIGWNAKTTRSKWVGSDNYTLTYFGIDPEVIFAAFETQVAKLESYCESLSTLGAAKVVAEFRAILEQYAAYESSTPVTELEAAAADLISRNNEAENALQACTELIDGIAKSNQLIAGFETNNENVAVVKDDLSTAINNAESILETGTLEDIENSLQALNNTYGVAQGAFSDYTALEEIIAKSNELIAGLENGKYVIKEIPATIKSNLTTAINSAESTLEAETLDAIKNSIETLSGAYSKASNIININYPLGVAKALADKIGGFESTAEYQKVSADLLEEDLLFAELVSDVQALNLVCKNAITLELLSTATGESPINLTSFITNPNIYQSGVNTEQPVGWTCNRGTADKAYFTTSGNGDTQLTCDTWSNNATVHIANSHYWQKIGGDAEKLNLPDGIYRVEAATYITRGGDKVQLYASSDSVDFIKANTNTNKDLYDEKRADLATTTILENVEVRGGVLYLGIKGTGVALGGAAGQFWNADNFRLYYVDSFTKLNNDNGAVSVSGDLEAALDELEENEEITSLDLSEAEADNSLTLTLANPNAIAYNLPSNVTLAQGINANDKTSKFTLNELYAFNAPTANEEVNLQYVRNFTTPTNNDNGGWQSIVLPFDVETITATQDGNEIELIPFAQWDEMDKEVAKEQGLRPFWLLKAAYDESIADEGYASADAIEANESYLIAIPNDPDSYDAYFNVSGNITFSGKGVQVTELYSQKVENEDEGVNYTLNTNFNGPTSDVYGLNTEGTDWVAGIDANSFHLYVTTSQANAPQRIAIFGNGGGTTGIKGIFSDFGKGQNGIGNAVVYGSKEGIVIESVKAGEAAIYSVSGELVKIAQVKEGRNIIKLPAGVYIINQNKVIVY